MYAIFAGIGMGFQFGPAMFVPQICFEKKRPLAITLSLSGFPIGSFIFCPIFQFLINIYGWRGAIFVTGAVVLNGCALGLILVPLKPLEKCKPTEERGNQNYLGSVILYSVEHMYDPTHTSDNEALKGYQTFLLKFKIFFDISILRSRLACVVFLLWLFYNLGYPVPPVFLPLVSSNYGISKDTTSFMLSVYGISELIGRLLYGITASWNKFPSVYLWCCASVATGIAQLSLTWAKTVPSIYFLLIIIGMNGGESQSTYSIV